MTLDFTDQLVLAGYFVAVLAVGLWFGRGRQDTGDYFLGGRRQPWLIVGLSIIATEVSALTFISVPADAFAGDWNYLQMYAGAFVGRILVVLLLLPAFYRGAVTTVYEYLGQRFGPRTRTTASLMFFASRIIGSGIRLLAASLAIAIVFGWRLEWVILGSAAVAIIYTTFGGIKAVIWTDALQALVFLGGGVVVLVSLFHALPGDWTENLSAVRDAGKLHTFTWDWHVNNDKAFGVLLIHAMFLNMAALGTDQDLTQRMLTCPDLRRGQRSLLFNAFAGLPIVCLFLLIGSLLWAYFRQVGGGPLPPDVLRQTDRIFPYYIAHVLPGGYGMRGLLVAGIFAAAMSSLDSALSALSSTAVNDFVRPWRRRKRAHRAEELQKRASARTRVGGSPDLRKGAQPAQDAQPGGLRSAIPNDEKTLVLVSRLLTVFFGVLLAGVAWAFAGHAHLLWEVFKWAGLIFGGLLGVFLLGVTTRTRGSDRVNPIAMLTSVAVLVLIKLNQEKPTMFGVLAASSDDILIAWPWWVVIGTAWTYILGACWKTRRPVMP